MNVINEWDWKFKIGIYKDMYQRISRVVDNFTGEEKEIYSKILEYHSNKASIDVILEELIEKEYKCWEETGMYNIEILKKKLIPVNSKITKLLKIKLEKAQRKNPKLKEDIAKLFEIACNKKSNGTETTEEIFRNILGNYYDKIIELVKERTEIVKKTKESLNDYNLKSNAIEYINQLSENKELQAKFGMSCISEFDIKVEEGVDFAEWWDKSLINSEKDLLILYNNRDALNKDDFEYTIYHEVYPGHGHFYNYVRNNADTIRNFDHGAITLVEGWATFCEWNVKNSKYGNSLKSRGKEFVNISLSKNMSLEDKINYIYNKNKERGYSEEQALNVILNFTQYPTFLESYYLGALCIEVMLKEGKFKNPIDFLNNLKDKTWGELFAIWG